MDKINLIAQKSLRTDWPEIKPGMVIKVWQKFIDTVVTKKGKKDQKEKKEIVKPFQGIVLAVKHGRGVNSTLTVRGEVAGQMIEKIFPYHSLTLQKVEILGHSKARRAKLYFLRHLSPSKLRKKLRTQYV